MQPIRTVLMYALCGLLILGAAAIYLGRGNPLGVLLIVPAALIWRKTTRVELRMPKTLASVLKPLPDNPGARSSHEKTINGVEKD